jgi:putative transposase
VKLLCNVMQVHRSGYYRYRHSGVKPRQALNVHLLAEANIIHAQSQQSYGSRRMAKALQAKDYQVGRYQARSLMRQGQLSCKQRKRYRVTTLSHPALPVAENVLNRAFTVKAPNRVWVADITFLWTLEGWLYVAAVLDLYSRRVVGWAMDSHMKTGLISQALNMAIGRRRPDTGLLHHSDRGSQYASYDYQQQLEKAGIVVSMSRKGNCWDNRGPPRL